ncbi:MFS transporter [Nitrospirillum amazonense]|uniref:spinster family MFS transporter n=1 Tax=Nitrospirillum amazonense TaxID=28077 RepID=UPI002DD41FFB|nr:MFS transporter [Nitrospirillum amazonense]MEC4592141.1 MFS transporter [Nitrospirillum amazonense]
MGRQAALHRRDTAYSWYVAVVMCLCFTFSYMDRALLQLLVGPIQKSFDLNDTQLGLLQGAAFAVFYTLFGFPLARVADTRHRRNLTLVGLVVWCAATAACGLAQNMPQLFGARICVAIGEAALAPAAVSLIADYFSPGARTRALSIYSMGVFFGSGLALGLGGTLLKYFGHDGAGQTEPWRMVFIILGAAGLLMVPLLLSVREPARLTDDGRRSEATASLRQVLAEFARKKAALLTTVGGFATTSMAASTLASWAPTFFVRVHGWALGPTGQKLGGMTLVLSPLGAIVGAMLADALTRAGRKDGKLIVGTGSAAFCAVASLVMAVTDQAVALVAIGSIQFVVGFNFGLVQACLAELVPNRMRAIASACYIASSNLLAATFGPLLVGVLNDHVFHDPMMIGRSIAIVAPGGFAVAALILAAGRRSYRSTLSLVAADGAAAQRAPDPAPLSRVKDPA